MPIRSIIAAALLLALAACGPLRLLYSQADLLIYRWIDGYADFDRQQAPRVREAIGRWLAWHRSTQLGDYAALLQRAAGEVRQDTTPERVCRWVDELAARADTAFARALPDAARLARRLGPEQLEHIERRQQKQNEKLREELLEPDRTERLEMAVERAAGRAEKLYGRLDAPQRERLAQDIAASPFDAGLSLAERERRQRDLLETLRALGRPAAGAQPPGAQAASAQAASPETAAGESRDAALLQGWWQRVRQSPDAAYRRYAERLEPYNCAVAARLHNATTPAQRETARRRLLEWRADLLQIALPR